MFTAGSSVRSRTPEEIFNQDFKEFDLGDSKIGISQINSMAADDLDYIRGIMAEYVPKARKERGLDMVFFMLTDILEEATSFLYSGENAEELVRLAFPGAKPEDGTLLTKGIVSRKKQVVPALMQAIGQLHSEE